MKWVWFLCCFLSFGVVLSRSEDGFEDLKARESLLSYLEHDAVAEPAPQPVMIGLTLIQGADSKGAGANSWLIHLEGGGWCNTIRSCVFRKTTRRGSSKFMEKQLPFTGILSNKAEENPDFYNWNRVKLRYCDGASFSGDSQNESAQLNFRGQRIWLAAIEELMAKGMQNAEQALLSGCSAGGLASILHCDEFRDLVPQTTKVKCLSDAGMFIDAVDVSGGRTLRDMFAGVVSVQDLQKDLPSTCTSQLDPTSVDIYLFSLSFDSRVDFKTYDVWQLQSSLAPSSADPLGQWKDCKADNTHCNSSQIQFLQDFRNEMLNTIKVFSESDQNGLFINSCFAHCQSERQDTWFANDSPVIGNESVAKSVGDWYFDRVAVKTIDCPYPCDNTCHNLVAHTDVISTITISQSTRLTFSLLSLLSAFLMSLTFSNALNEVSVLVTHTIVSLSLH
ncbi:hypothetical protein EZV62_010173 [Acer yangbiense]|uniref:Pectin acetylesterase n=1 Tax=Acer yangbiense TaxID=1000413 RepID=A0A5C7I2I7_9ROSI|nr:hypothetical protein EZV62_010173 [Acer yangbiense]